MGTVRVRWGPSRPVVPGSEAGGLLPAWAFLASLRGGGGPLEAAACGAGERKTRRGLRAFVSDLVRRYFKASVNKRESVLFSSLSLL